MNTLGIYFGPEFINLVESKAKRVINQIKIPQARISGGELEEGVPDEVRIVAIFKEELRRNKIEAKQAVLSLSGKDLIIRTFDIPAVLPKDELLHYAVNFEARKYIPFKVEDLISDFQFRLDKPHKKNLILFVGIKKEIINRYLSILGQLDLKIVCVEYSNFSLLRLLRLSGTRSRGIIGVLSVDFQDEEEINFTVLENGFPLFSRDITLFGGPQETEAKEKELPIVLEKLKSEIRISLDYYQRKFPTKNITKTYILSDKTSHSDLEILASDIGLAIQFIDVAKFNRFMGKTVPFSLGFLRAYAGTLTKISKISFKIDLLAAKEKSELLKKAELQPLTVSLFSGLKIDPRVVIMGLLLCIGSFVFRLYQRQPLEMAIKSIIDVRPRASSVTGDFSYERLSAINTGYKEKITALDNLIRKQLYLTLPLDVLPRIIPENVWLTDFSFKQEETKVELTLKGLAYLADGDRELGSVHTFLTHLKEDKRFNRYFKQINIVSLDRGEVQDTLVTKFVISCRN